MLNAFILKTSKTKRKVKDSKFIVGLRRHTGAQSQSQESLSQSSFGSPEVYDDYNQSAEVLDIPGPAPSELDIIMDIQDTQAPIQDQDSNSVAPSSARPSPSAQQPTISPQLDIRFSAASLSKWFPVELLTSSEGDATSRSRSARRKGVTGAVEQSVSQNTTVKDVMTSVDAPDTEANKSPDFAQMEEEKDGSPSHRKVAPAPIKIPKNGLKSQAGPARYSHVSLTVYPRSIPDSPISSIDNLSTVSGTTLARALLANSFILSSDSHSSRHRSSDGGWIRQDSATLPRSENPFTQSPYWKRISKGSVVSVPPDDTEIVPPVPPMPEVLSIGVKGPSPHQTLSDDTRQPSIAASEAGPVISISPSDVQEEEIPLNNQSQSDSVCTPYDPPPRGSSLASGTIEKPVKSLTKSRKVSQASLLAPLNLDAADGVRARSMAKISPVAGPSAQAGSPVEDLVSAVALSPPDNSNGVRPMSVNSERDIDSVLNDYKPSSDSTTRSHPAARMPSPGSSGSSNSKSDFSSAPMTVLNSSTRTASTSEKSEHKKSPQTLPSGAWAHEENSSSTPNFDSSAHSSPSVLMDSAAASASSACSSSSTSSPSTSTSSSSNDDNSEPPPRTGSATSRRHPQHTGSIPTPIMVVRDSVDPMAYKIAVSAELEGLDICVESPLSTGGRQQTFPETPRAFSPLFSAGLGAREGAESPAADKQTVPKIPPVVPVDDTVDRVVKSGRNGMLARAATFAVEVKSDVNPASVFRQVSEACTRPYPITQAHVEGAKMKPLPARPPETPTSSSEPSAVKKSPVASEHRTPSPKPPGDQDGTAPSASPSPSTSRSPASPFSRTPPSSFNPSTTSSVPSTSSDSLIFPSPPAHVPAPLMSTVPAVAPSPSSVRVPLPSSAQAPLPSSAQASIPLPKPPPPPSSLPPLPPSSQPTSPPSFTQASSSSSMPTPSPSFTPAPPSYRSPVHPNLTPEPLRTRPRRPSSPLSVAGNSTRAPSPNPYYRTTSRSTTSTSVRMRSRPRMPLGPREPSQPRDASSTRRARNGSTSSPHTNATLGTAGGSTTTRRKLSSKSSPKFQPPPLPWRGLTMEGAIWTFTSEQLQSIVSTAIKKSAEASFIRLLYPEVLDGEVQQASQRLQSLSTDIRTKYKLAVRRRWAILSALNKQMDGSQPYDSASASQLIDELADVSSSLDHLVDDIYATEVQMAQIQSLRDVHLASALAMALRKLNKSFLKQAAEVKALRQKVETLEAERDEAWTQAENVATELDDLNDKMADAGLDSGSQSQSKPASRRSSMVIASRKSSAFISKAGLRSSNSRRSLRVSTGSSLSRSSSLSMPSGRVVEHVPPVPPIPFIEIKATDFNPYSPSRPSTLSSTDTDTRAMEKAQRELEEMLNIHVSRNPSTRPRSRSMAERGAGSTSRRVSFRGQHTRVVSEIGSGGPISPRSFERNLR